jgi:GNAT superfamily N-acetyltransferase
MNLKPLAPEHFTRILPWFDNTETRRRLGGFYPVRPQLESMLSAPNKHGWLMWKEDTPVGLIELEKEDGLAYVLILVAPEKRGEGIGHLLVAALPQLARHIGSKSIRACIAADGLISQRCFLAAGYILTEEEDGFLSYDLPVSSGSPKM